MRDSTAAVAEKVTRLGLVRLADRFVYWLEQGSAARNMRLRPEERERGLALLRALIENGLVRRDVKSGAYHRTGAYSVKRLYETALNEWSTPTPRRSG